MFVIWGKPLQLYVRLPSLHCYNKYKRKNTLHSSVLIVLDNPQLINFYIKASVMTHGVICSSVPLTLQKKTCLGLFTFFHHLLRCFGNVITLIH